MPMLLLQSTLLHPPVVFVKLLLGGVWWLLPVSLRANR